MYRRPLFVLFESVYQALRFPRGRLVRLDARDRDDLLLASVLAPIGVTEVDAPILPQIFGLDASPDWGAAAPTAVDPATARALWTRGNQRGGYTRLDSTAKCLLRRIGHIEGVDENSEDHLLRAPAPAELQRPEDIAPYGYLTIQREIAMFYEHIAFAGGAEERARG